LEELLSILVFTGVEERVGAAFGLTAQSLDDVSWADGVVGGMGFV
jgi:hypothetical protein